MREWSGYRKYAEPRKAVLYVEGVAYDVWVLRERRGRYEVRLAEHYPKETAVKPNSDSQRVLRPGKVVSVPVTMVELL